MRDHTKLRAFELADEIAVLIYRVTAEFPREELYGLTFHLIEPKIVETEKVLNGLIRALQDD